MYKHIKRCRSRIKEAAMTVRRYEVFPNNHFVGLEPAPDLIAR